MTGDHGPRDFLIRTLRAVVLAAGVLLPAQLPAGDKSGSITVTEAGVEPGESAWILNAWVDIRLSRGAREALESGIPLVFDFQIQVLEKHPWLWDRVIREYHRIREVQYHPLTRTYIVKQPDTGEQRGFRRLDEAMESAGVLLNIDVIEYAAVDDRHDYTVRLRGTLDVESLPTPIRLLAYVSNEWDMKSSWNQWHLER